MEQVRQALVDILGDGAEDFTANEELLQKLATGGYTSARLLRSATRAGLTAAGVLPAFIDALLAAAAASTAAVTPTTGPPPSLGAVAGYLKEVKEPSLPRDIRLWIITGPKGSHAKTAASIFPPYFVDSSDIVGQAKAWFDHAQANYQDGVPLNRAVNDTPPLFFHGFIKSGKTWVLNVVLPAVLRAHKFFGVGAPAEMLWCQLDLDVITAQGTATYPSRLSALLDKLRSWAGSAAPPAEFAPGEATSIERLESEILTFFRTLGRPVLYTVDELQSWFILPDGDSNHLGRARVFLKNVLCYLPRNAAVAVTGSSMCLAWSNVAAMPPNGVALAVHNRTVVLPASNKDASDVAWGFLKRHCSQLPAELKALSPPLPAMLTFLCKEYLGSGSPCSVIKFVTEHEQYKIMAEMGRDFGFVLRQLPQDQRRLVFDMTTGDGVKVQELDNGLQLMLSKLLDTCSTTGRCRLGSFYHRMLIQRLVDRDGNMQPAISYDRGVPPILLLEARQLLLRFSNLVKYASDHDWEDHEDLRRFVQTMADMAEKEGLLGSDYFTLALSHRANARSRAIASNKWSSLSSFGRVVEFHCLLRNALAHEYLQLQDEDFSVLLYYPFVPSLAEVPAFLQPVRAMAAVPEEGAAASPLGTSAKPSAGGRGSVAASCSVTRQWHLGSCSSGRAWRGASRQGLVRSSEPPQQVRRALCPSTPARATGHHPTAPFRASMRQIKYF